MAACTDIEFEIDEVSKQIQTAVVMTMSHIQKTIKTIDQQNYFSN